MCSTRTFARKARAVIPEALLAALEPVLATLETLSEQILAMEKRIKVLGKEAYPEPSHRRGCHHGAHLRVDACGPVALQEKPGRGRVLGVDPGAEAVRGEGREAAHQ